MFTTERGAAKKKKNGGQGLIHVRCASVITTATTTDSVGETVVFYISREKLESRLFFWVIISISSV